MIIICKERKKSVTMGELSWHVGVKQFQKEEQKLHNNKCKCLIYQCIANCVVFTNYTVLDLKTTCLGYYNVNDIINWVWTWHHCASEIKLLKHFCSMVLNLQWLASLVLQGSSKVLRISRPWNDALVHFKAESKTVTSSRISQQICAR